jgi:uncharacterized protein YjeT (DUF2065 family)
MQKIKVNLFISVLVNIVYSLFVAMTLGTRIAVNFQLDGRPSGYQTPWIFAVIQIALCISFAILFLMLPWCVKNLPIKYVNIPNRNKWLTGEERDKSLKKLGFMVLLLGTVVIYFFTTMSMVVYVANISTPLVLPMLPFFTILLIFIGFVITWVIKLYKMFP